MRTPSLLFALLAAALPSLANAPLPPDTPVIVDGNVRVDAGDIEGFLERIPAERRAEARSSGERSLPPSAKPPNRIRCETLSGCRAA